MSLFFRRELTSAEGLLAERTGRRAGRRRVTTDEAMRASAVWACLRLRADLISTSPIDVYREVSGRTVEVPAPPVIRAPGGSTLDRTEWMYSSQVDLDRFGNCFGLVTARDALSLPAQIDLLPGDDVTVKSKGGKAIAYKVGGDTFDPIDIWHERQYTIAGVPVGLSPLAAAAMPISTGLSAQQFAADWFAGSGVPAAHLKNTSKVLDAPEAKKVKERFHTSVGNGDVFVTGNDWEYEMLGAKASESSFLEAQRASSTDICRFLGVPADCVDVAADGQASITYANITQRNLQLLILNLGPAVTRRERALSKLVADPRFVKINTDAVVLRMDPKSRAELNKILLDSRQRVPSEVRDKDDLPPFTPAQLAEIAAVYGSSSKQDQVTKERQPA